MKVKYTIRVYSDREIMYPKAYFNSTFQNLSRYWKPISFNGSEMVVESVVQDVELDQIEDRFDKITPELYESTTRTYRVM